jgi:hypothetical protein
MKVTQLSYIQQSNRTWIIGGPAWHAWQMITSLVLEQNGTEKHFNHSIASILHDDTNSANSRHWNHVQIHILCVDIQMTNSILTEKFFEPFCSYRP